MFTCNLTQEEAQIIIQILEQVLDDLRGEIRRTENFHYKDTLEERVKVLRKVLAELRGGQME